MSVACPHCGGEVFDGLDSDFSFCESCDELVEPVDAGGDFWQCFNCQDANGGDEECCNTCGLSRDASDYMESRS